MSCFDVFDSMGDSVLEEPLEKRDAEGGHSRRIDGDDCRSLVFSRLLEASNAFWYWNSRY